MENQDYEQKRAECWQDFCKAHPSITFKTTMRGRFKYIFDLAYALGKQEKESEGEEMLTVSRKKVQEMFTEVRKSVPTCEHDRGFRNAELTILRTLFGSKCLPDNVDTLEHNVDSLEPQAAEPEEDKAEAIAGKAIEPAEEHFDSIIKDSFSKERRLNVAAMTMQALLSNSAFTNKQTTPDSIVNLAIATADMLIKKVTTKK